MVAVVEVCRSGADKKVMDRTSMANESAAVHTERTALGVGISETTITSRGAHSVTDHPLVQPSRGELTSRGQSDIDAHRRGTAIGLGDLTLGHKKDDGDEGSLRDHNHEPRSAQRNGSPPGSALSR